MGRTKRQRALKPRQQPIQTAAVSWPSTILNVLPWLCVLAFAVPTSYTAIACWHTLVYPADANFGEGVLTYEASRLLHGQSIYLDPAQPPFWMATYPPLFQLLAAIGGATSLLWQRILSLLFSVLSGASLTLILRRMVQPWSIALLAPMLWFNSLFVEIWSVLGRVDMTGRGFCSLAIMCAVCIPRQRPAFLASLCFSLLAMLVKQNMWAGALTCALIFGLQSWRRASLFLIVWLLLLGFFYAGLNAVSGGWFWRDIFTLTNRGLSPVQFRNWVGGFLQTHCFYLVAALIGASFLVRSGRRNVWLIATVAVGIPNAILSANDGSDRNYFFDLVWPVCALAAIGTGGAVAITKSSRTLPFTAGAGLIAAAALLWNAVLLIHGPAEYPTNVQSSTAQQIIEQLRQSPKPVLCELSGFALRAGSEVEYLPYMLRKLEEEGRWNPAPIVELIQRKYYGAILLTHLAKNRFGSAELEAISQNYEVASEFPNQFLSEGSGTFVLLKPAGK